jgi:Na+-transporting NADH:ubiquinone oxidoreductase subunit NqrC
VVRTDRRGKEAYRYNKNTFISIVCLCTNTVVSAKLVIVVRIDRRGKEAYRYDKNTFILIVCLCTNTVVSAKLVIVEEKHDKFRGYNCISACTYN